MFREKDVLKNFAKFTGKHLCWSLFFNKVATPVKFAKFLKTSFFCRTPPVAACVDIKSLTDRYNNSILFPNESFYEV